MPPTRRQVYVRRRVTVVGAAGLLLGGLLYLPMTLLAPLHAATAEAVEPPAPSAAAAPVLDFPEYGASAIGLIDEDRTLGVAGTDQPLPMASISKLVTALVVLEQHPLAESEEGPSITMTAQDRADFEAFRAAGGSVVEVQAGWTFSQRDLVELTVVRSANNYATALRNWAFGDDAAFAAAARTWLDANGLPQTTMVEPTGLSPDNRSTATELLELGRLALQDPLIGPLVDVRGISVPNLGDLPATNRMLGELGIDGIKTGTLFDIVNLLFSSTFEVGGEQVRVVGVILAAPGPNRDILNQDVRELLSSAQAGFVERRAVTAGDEFAAYSTRWEQTTTAVAASDLSVVAWAGDEIERSVALEDTGVAPRGARVGTVTYTIDGETHEVPLELSGAITDPGAAWRLSNPFALLG